MAWLRRDPVARSRIAQIEASVTGLQAAIETHVRDCRDRWQEARSATERSHTETVGALHENRDAVQNSQKAMMEATRAQNKLLFWMGSSLLFGVLSIAGSLIAFLLTHPIEIVTKGHL